MLCRKKNFLRRNTVKYDQDIEDLYSFICNEEKEIKAMKLYPAEKTVKKLSKKPMVKSRINGQLCDMLIDTGADVNVIERSYLEK